MDQLAPLGPVYQAGTLSGNPLAMAAGLATIGYLQEHAAEVYPRLESTSKAVAEGVAREAAAPASPSPSIAPAPCGPGSSLPAR